MTVTIATGTAGTSTTPIVDGRTHRWYEANGNGGQWVMVFPTLDLVVGITGGKYMAGAAWYGWGLDAVARHIIPATQP